MQDLGRIKKDGEPFQGGDAVMGAEREQVCEQEGKGKSVVGRTHEIVPTKSQVISPCFGH